MQNAPPVVIPPAPPADSGIAVPSAFAFNEPFSFHASQGFGIPAPAAPVTVAGFFPLPAFSLHSTTAARANVAGAANVAVGHVTNPFGTVASLPLDAPAVSFGGPSAFGPASNVFTMAANPFSFDASSNPFAVGLGFSTSNSGAGSAAAAGSQASSSSLPFQFNSSAR